MLRPQPAHERDTVWDALLPVGVTVLPADPARVDELLAEPALLGPFPALWRACDAASGRQAESFGRPTSAMATYVRLMLLKARTGWGYATLLREVSDPLHLRRCCLLPLTDPAPTESTVRKRTRRLGPDVVAELIRGSSRWPPGSGASRRGRCAPTRPSSRPTSATRPMPAWPRPVSGCWPPAHAGWAGPSMAASPTSGIGAGRSGGASGR